MQHFIRRVKEAVKDFSKVLFNNKCSFGVRLQITYALLQLKLNKQKQGLKIDIFGKKMRLLHPSDVQFMIKEIWLESPYFIPKKYPINHIVDLGANQGFSVLYFSQQHPTAHIIAIEADVENFKILQENASQFGPNIEVLQKAAWNVNGSIELGNNDGVLSTNRSVVGNGGGQKVEAFDFADWLKTHPADLVKMDIEGAEAEVMESVIQAGMLDAAKHWLIEFHSERFGDVVYDKVNLAFQNAGFFCEKRGIIGYFFKPSYDELE